MNKRLKYLEKYNIYDDYTKVAKTLSSASKLIHEHSCFLMILNFERKWKGHKAVDDLGSRLRNIWRYL